MADDKKAPSKAEDKKAEQVDEGLVTMVKLGHDDLQVHPTCVAAHEAAGWKAKE